METGETPQPSKLEIARNIALERGSRRREDAARRISGLFRGIRKKITMGVDFVLGFPDAASYLGTEAVKFGEEKGTEVRDSVVEAGMRAWESIVDTKNRLVQRGINAKNRVVARYEQTREATKAKVVDLFKRAAVWGLTNVADPIEKRLQQIYEIPAGIREWWAGREDVRAQQYETKAKLGGEVGEARVKALQEEITRIQEATEKQVEIMYALKDAAAARAEDLKRRATDRREKASQKFGKARAAVQKLQTS